MHKMYRLPAKFRKKSLYFILPALLLPLGQIEDGKLLTNLKLPVKHCFPKVYFSFTVKLHPLYKEEQRYGDVHLYLKCF